MKPSTPVRNILARVIIDVLLVFVSVLATILVLKGLLTIPALSQWMLSKGSIALGLFVLPPAFIVLMLNRVVCRPEHR